ncbi:hypothetical protein B0H16DRAFT_1470625 [Mycena metata]|uniref:Uncharacterized protein n=1 Tax=Mycena metata TaxID=1033252 RepID=A0AAD7HU42_9AGAR|nr:hypothetical protein B0H16DRAFT_1470625 [Mycena metata]
MAGSLSTSRAWWWQRERGQASSRPKQSCSVFLNFPQLSSYASTTICAFSGAETQSFSRSFNPPETQSFDFHFTSPELKVETLHFERAEIWSADRPTTVHGSAPDHPLTIPSPTSDRPRSSSLQAEPSTDDSLRVLGSFYSNKYTRPGTPSDTLYQARRLYWLTLHSSSTDRNFNPPVQLGTEGVETTEDQLLSCLRLVASTLVRVQSCPKKKSVSIQTRVRADRLAGKEVSSFESARDGGGVGIAGIAATREAAGATDLAAACSRRCCERRRRTEGRHGGDSGEGTELRMLAEVVYVTEIESCSNIALLEFEMVYEEFTARWFVGKNKPRFAQRPREGKEVELA